MGLVTCLPYGEVEFSETVSVNFWRRSEWEFIPPFFFVNYHPVFIGIPPDINGFIFYF